MSRHIKKKSRHAHSKTKTRKSKKRAGGSSSTGDLVRVEYRAKHRNLKAARRAKRFKNRVKNAISDELPIAKVVIPKSGRLFAPVGECYQFLTFGCRREVADLRLVMEQVENLAPSTNDFSEQFTLLNDRIEGFYSNSGNSVAILDMYTVVPRINNVNSPYSDFTQADGQLTTGGGEYSVYANTTIPANVSYIGLNPFISRQFCQKWKILKKTRVILQPGETKEFLSVHKRKTVVKGNMFQEGTTPNYAIKGTTLCNFVFIHGQPTHDGDGVVSTSPVSVDWVSYNTYVAQAIPSFETGTAGQSKIAFVTKIAPITNPKIREEFDPASLATAVNSL